MTLEELLEGVGLEDVLEMYKRNRKMMERIDAGSEGEDLLQMEIVIPDYMDGYGNPVRFRSLTFSQTRTIFTKTTHTYMASQRGGKEPKTAILLIPSGTEK